MKTYSELQTGVQYAIKREPLLNAAEIGVIAKDGVVSLSDVVDSYSKKLEGEDAAKKAIGVKAVVEKLRLFSKFMDKYQNNNRVIYKNSINY